MNPTEREQLFSSTEIFADASLNLRFYTAIELLAQIVMVMPRTAHISVLVKATGKTPRLVRSILATLSRDGLVARDTKEKDAWHCRCCNGIITLADIYRCFCLAGEAATANSLAVSQAGEASAMDGKNDGVDTSRSASQNSVDLLMMQVKMTVNRAVLQQLEQFDLGRLRGLNSAPNFRRHNVRLRAYTAEPS
jgi:hypothetical protein